jgi:futalosine hydrolase
LLGDLAENPKLLICAATERELAAFGVPSIGMELLVTGVGIPLALARTLEVLGRVRPARVLNIGIAGAYPGSGLAIGDLMMGLSEVYGDIGFELPETPGFRFVGETEWGKFYREPLWLSQFAEFAGLPVRPGCTVNSCTGTEKTGRLRETLFGAGFETMEGAAIAQAGAMLGIPVCEIRAISNFASRRDMRPENIGLALHRLSEYFKISREKL